MRSTRNTIKWILAAVAVTAFLTSCSDDDKDPKSKKSGFASLFGIGTTQDVKTLHVTDRDGNAISSVQVLIGGAVDSPFVQNFMTTDAGGAFTAPDAWTDAQIVTLAAPGYVRASYFGQIPNGQTFQMRAIAAASGNYELTGQGTGFKTIDNDDTIDFALMIPSLQKQDLFAFDLNMFVSPQTDEISVYGQKIDLPSNISLPKQKEKYGIFPVTLEKPIYRMYYPGPGAKAVYTVRGQFPFKKVVNEMQSNKQFIDLINDFSLLGGSLTTVTIAGATTNQDLPVNSLVYDQTRSFKSPVIGSDETLLAIPLSTYQGQLIPTDLKTVAGNSTPTLTTASGSTPQLLSVLKKTADANSFSRISTSLMPFDVGAQPEFLPLLDAPTVLSQGEVSIALPAAPADIQPVATYSVLSTVETKVAGTLSYEIETPQWEVYADQWQAGFKLPVWPNDVPVAGKRRWQVSLMGTQVVASSPALNKAVDLGPSLFENVTHATRGSSDF